MKEYNYLSAIDSPDDLKRLPEEHLSELTDEIRDCIIDTTLKNGGHLASNLGVVELTLALHRVFDLPKDKIIWDVGHQTYAHKLMTGRRERFDTLRTPGGLSGFAKRSESEYDCFGCGHSSTSLSAAIGFAEAERLAGSDAYTVAVIGDGAFTGGMIHEALNNCRSDLKLIIVLNENEMSISKNIGLFAKYMARIRSSERYYNAKKNTANLLLHIPLVGKGLFSFAKRVKQTLKNIMYGSNYFEELGFYYLGPADGNKRETVETLLCEAKKYGKSTVVHLKTKKGKGFEPAETRPDIYHSISGGKYARDGSLLKEEAANPTFSKALGELLSNLAEEYTDICAVTAAMSAGTGLDSFREAHKDRFFDVGIAEEHALTFCAGLAADGLRPFFAVYSTFLQRGYDNIIHDIALQKLPVVICIDRAGINRCDGATHHGIYDGAFLSHIPGMTLFAPPTLKILELSLKKAYALASPCAIRYSNCHEDETVISAFYPSEPTDISLAVADFLPECEKKKILITYGRIASEVLRYEKSCGEECGTVLLEQLCPFDATTDKILGLLPETVEEINIFDEGIENGGVGMMIKYCLMEKLKRTGREILPQIELLAISEEDALK